MAETRAHHIQLVREAIAAPLTDPRAIPTLRVRLAELEMPMAAGEGANAP